MKLLHISSVYNELIEIFENKNLNYKSLNHTDHFNKFINFSRGQEYSFSYYLKFFGIETEVFYMNYFDLEKKKYLPNSKKKNNFSKLTLLENKIEEFKPDILYIQNSIFFTHQVSIKSELVKTDIISFFNGVQIHEITYFMNENFFLNSEIS